MAGTPNGQAAPMSGSGAGPYQPMNAGMQQPNVFQTSAGAYNQAVNMAGQAGQPVNPASYNAAQVTNVPQLGGRSLNQYMNPYTDQVINRARQDLRRSNRMAVNDLDAAASAAGAFGGSRHGVAQALTNEGFGNTMADMTANLRQQGFQNAQQAAQFDIGNLLGVRQYNTGALNQQRAANAGYRQQARMAAPGQSLSAAGTLGALSQQGFNMGTQLSDRQARDGAMQQMLNQSIIDAARGQFGGFTGAPGTGLAQLMGAVGGVPYGQNQTTSQRPGLFNLLAAGLAL